MNCPHHKETNGEPMKAIFEVDGYGYCYVCLVKMREEWLAGKRFAQSPQVPGFYVLDGAGRWFRHNETEFIWLGKMVMHNSLNSDKEEDG
jgi:hypothetical protein